jgi:hypothetical protein
MEAAAEHATAQRSQKITVRFWVDCCEIPGCWGQKTHPGFLFTVRARFAGRTRVPLIERPMFTLTGVKRQKEGELELNAKSNLIALIWWGGCFQLILS